MHAEHQAPGEFPGVLDNPSGPNVAGGTGGVSGSALGVTLAASMALAGLACPASVFAQALPEHQSSNPWFTEAQASLQAQLQRAPLSRAKNVILFVGDGMGVSTLTAARIHQGQLAGRSGEEGYLSFERFPYSALLKTYNVDAQTPDSAGSMVAMLSGVKTDAGVLGVDENARRGDCASARGNEVFTVLELAELKGLATGLVTNARLTHALPAASYATGVERDWESEADLPEAARIAGCDDFAAQFIGFEQRLMERYGVDAAARVDGFEVAFGGGRTAFEPNEPDAAVADIEGRRSDGRHLLNEWQVQYPAGQLVFDSAGFDALTAAADTKMLGLFDNSHMRYEIDRSNDPAGEPSLAEMTGKALEQLALNPDGFVLIVAAARIGHAHQTGNAHVALRETIALSDAVATALQATRPEETLILVTATQSHGLTISGYPQRGNPVLGKAISIGGDAPALAADGLPYTTLGYANGPGFRDLGSQTNPDLALDSAPVPGRQDLSAVDTTAPGFHPEALIPLRAATHGAEDVAVHATGPGAHRVRGTMEQNAIFHVINQAIGLVSSNR